MRRSDFHYELPAELIAQHPLPERSGSRLLVLDGSETLPRDRMFTDLPSLLKPHDLLIFNNTQVMRARLFGHKETGGQVEILIERLLDAHEALAHVRASKSPKPGSRIRVIDGAWLSVVGREGDLFRLRALESDFSEQMARHGHMPLPPYIHRPDEVLDESRYQTVFARRTGAVAAAMVAWARVSCASGIPISCTAWAAATQVCSTLGAAMPMSSLALITNRRAMKRGSSPASSIRAR